MQESINRKWDYLLSLFSMSYSDNFKMYVRGDITLYYLNGYNFCHPVFARCVQEVVGKDTEVTANMVICLLNGKQYAGEDTLPSNLSGELAKVALAGLQNAGDVTAMSKVVTDVDNDAIPLRVRKVIKGTEDNFVLCDDNEILCCSSLHEVVSKALLATENNVVIALAHLLRALALINITGATEVEAVWKLFDEEKDLLSDMMSKVEFVNGADIDKAFRYASMQSCDWEKLCALMRAKVTDKGGDDANPVLNVLHNIPMASVRNCETNDELVELVRRFM